MKAEINKIIKTETIELAIKVKRIEKTSKPHLKLV